MIKTEQTTQEEQKISEAINNFFFKDKNKKVSVEFVVNEFGVFLESKKQ